MMEPFSGTQKFYRELEASARGNTPIIPMTDVQQIFSGLPKVRSL